MKLMVQKGTHPCTVLDRKNVVGFFSCIAKFAMVGQSVLARTELTFFRVAIMGLCFGFVLETGMFFLLLRRACTARPFLCLPLLQHPGGWRCLRRQDGTQLGQLAPADQKDIPDNMMSYSAYGAGGRSKKRGDIQSDDIGNLSGFNPRPETKPHTAPYSLPHQQDQGENWKDRSQKSNGLR